MRGSDSGRLHRAASALLVGALVWASVCFAQEPTARCSASLAGGRVVVEVDLLGFLDKDLLKLVRLGMKGQLSLEVSVVKRRRFWFDVPVETQSRIASLSYERAAGELVLDGHRRVVDPALLSLERVAIRVGRDPDETYGVEITARLQVVTAASLDNVAEWISGGRDRNGAGLPRNMLQAVADDLARGASGRCEVEARR